MASRSAMILLNFLIVAITVGHFVAGTPTLQAILEQESVPSGLSICLSAESHPESVEYKIKCLSSLMNEFYNALTAHKFKKAYALARIMNKFEPIHPDIKESSSEIDESDLAADPSLFARSAMFNSMDSNAKDSGRDKRRTFFVGK